MRRINWREFWYAFCDGLVLRFLWDRNFWKDFWK